MRFPVTDLLDEEECYRYLLDALHPEGLSCPSGHPLPDGQAPHDRTRAPIVKYCCLECGAVYNLLTDTVWSGTHYDCKTVVMVLRGIAQGVPTLQLAEELDLDYSTLLSRRHQIQEQALQGMYFPAMTALRFNSAVKAFGDRLEKRGKEEMVVIGAAMRKLLHICDGVLKSGRFFGASLAPGT